MMNHKLVLAGMVAYFIASGPLYAGWSDYLDIFKPSTPVSEQDGAAQATTLTNDETISGLKAALANGTQFAVKQLGRKDGFMGNDRVRIPMPKSLLLVEKTLRTLRQDKLADEFITSMNRAAEQAVPQAAKVFGDAINAMTMEDARKILTGPDDAATRYFESSTRDTLIELMRPIITQATDSAGVTSSYKSMMSKAGGMTSFLSKDTTDLDGYVTDKALDGLFRMIAEEEKRIRTNPVARTTAILKKVFGTLTP